MVSDTKGSPSPLREMTRKAVRAEIATTAVDLFAEQGFEQTTVDQIAAEVGMSARSVFRYFPSKEDMVVGGLMELGHDVASALEQRPAREEPWRALRHALQVCVASFEAEGVQRATMLAETPALRTAMAGKHMQWRQLLVPHVTERLDGPADGPEALREMRAHALVSCALACLDVAATEWTHLGGRTSLGSLLDKAIGAVRDKDPAAS